MIVGCCRRVRRLGGLNDFIAPSLPIRVDQAVDDHTTRAPAPPTPGGGGSGLSQHKRVRRAITWRCLASGMRLTDLNGPCHSDSGNAS